MKGAHRGVLTMTTNDNIVCRLVATSLTVMWHLDLLSEKSRGGGELSHLGSSSPVSVRGCWPVFVSSGVVCIHSRAFFVVLGLSVLVIVASDVALPRCHWWSCAMFVGSRWRL